MRRVFITILFTIYCGFTYGQNVYRISLKELVLDTTGFHFNISEVIDARRDKNVLGIIQKGMSNKKNLAVFEKPRLTEIEDILIRSGLASKDGYVLRVTNLYISEFTHALKETARAELSVDFFAPVNNGLYHYISSMSVAAEPSGMDVTAKHSANIVTVLQRALGKFENSTHSSYESQSYVFEQLVDNRLTFKPSEPEILLADVYKEGFYTSFDEFLMNDPSISPDCEVSLGKKIMVKCGESERQTEMFGFAKDNVLYVLFHGKFFPLKNDEDGFYFLGPKQVVHNSSQSAAWMTFGMLGYLMASDAQAGYYETYRLDLSTGGIKSKSGF